jgi:hypothetical protein
MSNIHYEYRHDQRQESCAEAGCDGCSAVHRAPSGRGEISIVAATDVLDEIQEAVIPILERVRRHGS